jgi:selenocysteine lyase/cysteine desulfurase
MTGILQMRLSATATTAHALGARRRIAHRTGRHCAMLDHNQNNLDGLASTGIPAKK